ncbi:MAG: SGNH/GDSL hydrolase family protein [Deltaproteobacteria bacterium]|nr:SGNH/GDSL hydrolase family protein [Deltaproteobacteria bacterium]
MKPARRRLADLALLAAGLLAALGLAEGGFRWYRAARRAETRSDEAWRARIKRMNTGIYRRSDSAELVYEPSCPSRVQMPYGWAGFNAACMRDDRDYALEPAGRARLALLGDSLAWSEHLPVADALSRGIEAALDGQAEVLNFGVSGYDALQVAAWYERAVRRFRPDAVVWVYCLNDALIMSGPYNTHGSPADLARKAAQDAFFTREAPVRAETLEAVAEREEEAATIKIGARLRAWYRGLDYACSDDYTDEYLLAYADPARAERVRAALERLGRAARADGAAALLVIAPVLRSWDCYRWTAIHRRVAGMAREAGFAVLDPIERWQAETRPEDLRLPGDSLHFSAAGNRVLGRLIAEAVREDLRARAERRRERPEAAGPRVEPGPALAAWLARMQPHLSRESVERAFAARSAGSTQLHLVCHVVEGRACYFATAEALAGFDGRYDPEIERPDRRLPDELEVAILDQINVEFIEHARHNCVKLRCARAGPGGPQLACEIDWGWGKGWEPLALEP